MSAWAKPGAKCVCIDASSGAGGWWGDAPINGQVYTIRDVWVDDEGATVLNFLELQRSLEAEEYHGHRLGYWSWRFRPLITRTQEQDLALFTPILDGLRVGADA